MKQFGHCHPLHAPVRRDRTRDTDPVGRGRARPSTPPTQDVKSLTKAPHAGPPARLWGHKKSHAAAGHLRPTGVDSPSRTKKSVARSGPHRCPARGELELALRWAGGRGPRGVPSSEGRRRISVAWRPTRTPALRKLAPLQSTTRKLASRTRARVVGGRPAGGRERARSPRVLYARSARERVLRGVGDRSADGARVGRGPRRRRSEASEHAREDFIASPAESAIASSASCSGRKSAFAPTSMSTSAFCERLFCSVLRCADHTPVAVVGRSA